MEEGSETNAKGLEENQVNKLKMAAEDGNHEAMFQLGIHYKSHKNFKKAASYLQQAIDKSQHPDSFYHLADLYHEGEGVPENKKKSIELYKSSISKGGKRAATSLALIYHSRHKYDKCVKNFEIALEGGVYHRISLLGDLYREGLGTAKNTEKAIKCFELAAEKDNDRLSLYKHAKILLEGEGGIRKDIPKALQLLEKSAQADIEQAMYDLALIHQRGEIVAKNPKKAFELFSRCAECEHGDAYYQVGLMYLRGEGTTRDMKKAISFLELSTLKGSALGMYYLATILRTGQGVAKNPKQAIQLFKKSADCGNIDSLFMLGNMYCNGEGTEKDIPRGIEIFEKCADQGNHNAMYNLGNMNILGEGINKDLGKGVLYMQKAADAGNKFGMLQMGKMYFVGNEKIPQDIGKALEYFEKCDELNEAEAYLSKIYRNGGEGIPKNYLRAIQHFEKISKKGGFGLTQLPYLYHHHIVHLYTLSFHPPIKKMLNF